MHVQSETINFGLLRVSSAIFAALLCMPFLVNAQATNDPPPTTPPPADPTVANATPSQLIGSQELSNQGIFGCLGRGAQVASNPGTTRAIGGVYVPVNDAAVTLNTGFLVYKECILDGMARNIAQNYTAEMAAQQLRQFTEAREGRGQWLRNFPEFLDPYNIQITTNSAQGIQGGGMCGAYRNRVATLVARNFLATRGGTVGSGTCTFSSDGDRTTLVNGITPINWGAPWTGLISGDYELYRANEAIIRNDTRMAVFGADQRTIIGFSRGVIPIYDGNQDPLRMNIVTPGFIIADAIGQITGSGYRQLEQANEIDQIVSNLWGGLTTRLLSSGSGVPGLFVTTGTQPAYIDRMVAQTQAAVRTGAVNAAVLSLQNVRQSEAAYLEAKQGTANALISAISQLRTIENQCWNLIIPAVQTYAQANGNPSLSIATSIQFSQAVINDPANNILTLATTTAADVTTSQQALATIDQLIVQVTNSSSPSAQQQALLQIDQLVAQGRIHTQADAQAAAAQRDSITQALNTLINDTKTAWGDGQDPNVSWCNVNNTAVVVRWFDEWR